MTFYPVKYNYRMAQIMQWAPAILDYIYIKLSELKFATNTTADM